MTTRQSTGFSGVLGDAAHEAVMTGLLLARESTRGSLALVGGMVGGVRDLTVRTTGSVERSVRSVTDSIFSRVGDAIDLRMTRLLNAFQIPTSRDLHELTERVERLTAELAASRAKPAARRRTPRKTNGRG